MKEKRGGADVYSGLPDNLGVVSCFPFRIAMSILPSKCWEEEVVVITQIRVWCGLAPGDDVKCEGE